MLDVYQGPAAHHLQPCTFGNITSYVATAPGPSDRSHRQPQRLPPGSSPPCTHESLNPAAQYTLLLSGTAASLKPLLLKDQSTPAPANQAALRFVDQVTAPHAFDVYLVPPGTSVAAMLPILTNQTFNGNSGYLNIPAGSYRIVLYSSGTAPSTALPAAYSGTTVAYTSGTVRTIVLLDQKIPLRPSVQLVTATDVDSTITAN